MARLKRLIRGQDIAFDTHQSGDGQDIHWQALHLEKRLHKGGKIRFPFFGNESPTMTERVSDRDYSRVVAEVRRELSKNRELAHQLADTVVTQIARFRSGSVTIAQAQEAAGKIAGAFDLGEEFIASAVIRAEARISSFATLHPGSRPGTVVEVVQSAEGVLVQKPSESWGAWRRDKK